MWENALEDRKISHNNSAADDSGLRLQGASHTPNQGLCPLTPLWVKNQTRSIGSRSRQIAGLSPLNFICWRRHWERSINAI